MGEVVRSLRLHDGSSWTFFSVALSMYSADILSTFTFCRRRIMSLRVCSGFEIVSCCIGFLTLDTEYIKLRYIHLKLICHDVHMLTAVLSHDCLRFTMRWLLTTAGAEAKIGPFTCFNVRMTYLGVFGLDGAEGQQPRCSHHRLKCSAQVERNAEPDERARKPAAAERGEHEFAAGLYGPRKPDFSKRSLF